MSTTQKGSSINWRLCQYPGEGNCLFTTLDHWFIAQGSLSYGFHTERRAGQLVVFNGVRRVSKATGTDIDSM